MLEHPPGASAPQASNKDKARAEMQMLASGWTQSGHLCKPPATHLAKHTDVPSSSCRTGAAHEKAECVWLMAKGVGNPMLQLPAPEPGEEASDQQGGQAVCSTRHSRPCMPSGTVAPPFVSPRLHSASAAGPLPAWEVWSENQPS